jgi:glycerophosphoryl diester phosphodiesterase
LNRFRERIGTGPAVVIAHRGDSAHAPENTLDAARLGHAAGAFAWELDVHLSRDGVPVVVHDESLLRTTDVAQRFARDPRARSGFRVADFSWFEIRQLDTGSWFLDPAGPHRSALAFGTLAGLPQADRDRYASGAVRVPSLLEALELTRELEWLVNIELKTFPEAHRALLAAVFAAIDATDTADRVLLSSFDHRDVADAAHTRPGIATGALIETPLHRATPYVRNLVGADFLHLSAPAVGAESREYRAKPSSRSLRGLDEDESPVPRLVYTVNDARPDGLAAHLAAIGVAGIFTDDPGALRALWPHD